MDYYSELHYFNPCTTPLNATTTGIGLTSATLGWDAVSGAWGYMVRHKEPSQGYNAWVYDTLTSNTYALTGLPNATTYHWQVATMCDSTGVNNSVFSSYITFTTTAAGCTTPTGMNTTNILLDKATLNWL